MTQNECVTSTVVLLLQSLLSAAFGKQSHMRCMAIMNKGLSTLVDTPGKTIHLRRKKLLYQMLDRTALQILLIHLQICVKVTSSDKEK